MLGKGIPGRTYNIGGDCEITNLQLVLKISSILDEILPSTKPYSELITFVEDRPGHDRRYAIDSNRIKLELGWKPDTSFSKGLKKFFCSKNMFSYFSDSLKYIKFLRNVVRPQSTITF